MLSEARGGNEELRLALGMRGGVSLAVWIGGACAEIDELRRADGPRPDVLQATDGDDDDRKAAIAASEAAAQAHDFWKQVLEASRYRSVVVDVMAGASAGGLNGVLFAAAIRHGFRMDQLLRIWRNVGGIDTLLRKDESWLSLFDGDRKFLDVIRHELTGLIAGGTPPSDEEVAATYIDLQLSATLLEPIELAATSPSDEALRRTRSDARFHFRHDPQAALPRSDVEPAAVPQLAVAARATASFPAAFDGALVRSSRAPTFDSIPSIPPSMPESEAARLADCHRTFSDRRGPAERHSGIAADDFVVADGGVVDNIPLSKAIDGIREAPADKPTRRVVVYLHPTGPASAEEAVAPPTGESDEAQNQRRRGPVAVAKASSPPVSRASRSTVTSTGSRTTTAGCAWPTSCGRPRSPTSTRMSPRSPRRR